VVSMRVAALMAPVAIVWTVVALVGGAAQDGVNFQVFGHQDGGVDRVRLFGHAQQRDPPARREVRVRTRSSPPTLWC